MRDGNPPMKDNCKLAPAKRGRKSAPAKGLGPLVVVGNLKGGSGKSTVAFNLAVWLSTQGIDLTLVDLDPQKTLSDLVAVRQEIGASPSIASPDFVPPAMEPPVNTLGTAVAGRWTLIDFGAADMARMNDVLPHADIVLVPVLPSQADIWATQRYLKQIVAQRKPTARIALFVNRAEPMEASRETRETLTALKAMAGMCEEVIVLPTMLGRRVAFCRSLSEGQGVFEFKKESKASKEFQAFAKSVMALS